MDNKIVSEWAVGNNPEIGYLCKILVDISAKMGIPSE